ncbi:MAG: DUF3667 domain-containing protein [Opitutaceae bacterium]
MDTPRPDFPRCRNCGSDLTGAYCGQCGQRDLDFRRDWRGLVSEVTSTFLNLDGKVPRGLFALLFRPGFLTRRFLDGARASQIPPLRLYLFVSLCFFLLIGQSSDETDIILLDEAPVEVTEGGEHPPRGALAEWIVSKLDDPAAVREQFMVWLPRLFLIGVPLLALFLRVMFWRQPLVYLEHLVIALHLQSFLFLWILLGFGMTLLLGLLSSRLASGVELGVFGWLVVYPVFAFRRIFQFGWVKAILTAFILESGYLIFLFFVLFAVAAVALWFV